MRKISVGVIGLGKFGLSFAQALMDLRQEVVGLDSVPEHVRNAQDILTQVYQGDAMDRKILEQLNFADFGVVMVSVGQSIEASAMISLYLKELGAAQVWVKAVSQDHQKLLERIGVDRVILPFDAGMALREITIDKWAGKTLRDLDMTNVHGAQVVAVRRHGESAYTYVPRADMLFARGDVMVVLGSTEALEKMKA
jgi:trk system potassium uptake protein TrkA